MTDEQLFEVLGFTWDRSVVPVDVPVYSVERATFRLHKALPEYVWDASVLEGNPFTFPEVQALLDGVTVGGHRLSDERQVLNLIESARELLRLVRERRFTFDKATSSHLHAIIAREEAFDAGHFRHQYPGPPRPRVQHPDGRLFLTDCHPDADQLMAPALRAVLDG